MKLKNPLITRKLRIFYFKKRWRHKEVQQYLHHHYCTSVSIRTLKRWKKRLFDPNWKHPKIPVPPKPRKIASEQDTNRLVSLRKKTGWGALTLKYVFNFQFSESTCKRIIKEKGLSRGSKIENKRIHWVKWQRSHPDSLWQLDGSKLPSDEWILPVIDDCSRYCIGQKKFKTLTTQKVIKFLEELFAIHGKPRELLTDNGTEFGGVCKSSKFDQWCEEQGVKHIRSRIHKPTTAGKIERFHGTHKSEIVFCEGDYELFRYRYNHIRPHRSLYMKTPAEVYFSREIRIKGTKKIEDKWWG